MKIYLATVGSRGDNEPFRALALEASSAGHEVYFAHTDDIAAHPTAPYTDLELRGSIGKIIAKQGVSVMRALLTYPGVMRPLLKGAAQDTTNQILNIKPDVVVYHPKIGTAAAAAHAVGGIAIRAEMVPMLTPTSDFAPVGMPSWWPASWNESSYSLVNAAVSAWSGPAKRLAKRLGAIRIDPDISLVPVSPAIIPVPEDWPADTVMTGPWFAPEQGQLDEELATFLNLGAIVYAGFGSMKDSHGAQRADAIVSAARSLGMRVLLVTGWGGMIPSAAHEAAPDVLVRESVPHADVLPRVSVAIHHGGAGTVHSALRAGVPSVIIPFLGDQPWWARHLHQRGLGPQALPRKTTRYQDIAYVLVKAKSYRDAVKLASLQMATEDGLAKALEIMEQAEAGVHPFRAA